MKKDKLAVYSGNIAILGALYFLKLGLTQKGRVWQVVSHRGLITPNWQIHMLKEALDIIDKAFAGGTFHNWVKHTEVWRNEHPSKSDRYYTVQQFILPIFSGSKKVDLVGNRNVDPAKKRPYHSLKGNREHLIAFLEEFIPRR